MDKKIEELFSLAQKNNRVYKSDFFKKEKDYFLKGGVLSGGYEAAERVTYLALPKDFPQFCISDYIKCIKIIPNDKGEYSHRDYLGAVMSLQIERDKLGDLIVGNGCAYLVGFEPMIGFIRDSLASVSKTGCSSEYVDLSALGLKTNDQKEKTVSVSSMRLDVLVSACFCVSREKAKTMIEKTMVKINNAFCEKCEKQVPFGSTISAKGFGRAEILQEIGSSRKGKTVLKIKI